MLNADILRLAGVLAAPALFILLALAALGAPLLAFICLLAAQAHRTQYHEAYGRRLLRMAPTCALPSLLLLVAGVIFGVRHTIWLGDWFRAAPGAPILTAAALTAYCVALVLSRRMHPRYRHDKSGDIAKAFGLSLLALACLGAALFLTHSVGRQFHAVLTAPAATGISVAPLLRPDVRALSPFFWTIAVAAVPLSLACAGSASLEYLLLRRDREPFGREAFDQTLKLAARATFRCAFIAAAFLPALWSHVAGSASGKTLALMRPEHLLILVCGGTLLAACFFWIVLARCRRPSARPLLVHGSGLLLWTTLALLLATGLIRLSVV